MLVLEVEIPTPIPPSFAKRASTVLGLDESGEMIISAVYDEYRENYDSAYDKVKVAGHAEEVLEFVKEL